MDERDVAIIGAGAYLSSKSEKEVAKKEDEQKGIRKKDSRGRKNSDIRSYLRHRTHNPGIVGLIATLSPTRSRGLPRQYTLFP